MSHSIIKKIPSLPKGVALASKSLASSYIIMKKKTNDNSELVLEEWLRLKI